MNNELPSFKYHPDPIKTEMIKKSDTECLCCNKIRGFIYVGPIYSSRDDLDNALCPWCIADGTASKKYDTFFGRPSDYTLSKSIIDEIKSRTPGFHSWQQEAWFVHCNDACEYHGLATAKYLRDSITPSQKMRILQELEMDEKEWSDLISTIPKDNEDCVLDSPELHIFICSHCAQTFYQMSYC